MMRYVYLPLFFTGAPSPVYTPFGVERIYWDAAKFQGATTVDVYFEAIMKCADTAYRCYARLVNLGDSTIITTINTTSITPDRVRSSVLSMPAGPVELRAEFGGEPFRGPFTVFEARLVVEIS